VTSLVCTGPATHTAEMKHCNDDDDDNDDDDKGDSRASLIANRRPCSNCVSESTSPLFPSLPAPLLPFPFLALPSLPLSPFPSPSRPP